METAVDVNVLKKRPQSTNQRKKSFTLSMEEFADLVQGLYVAVQVFRNDGKLKVELKRDDLLTKTRIVPFCDHSKEWAFYVVDYSSLV